MKSVIDAVIRFKGDIKLKMANDDYNQFSFFSDDSFNMVVDDLSTNFGRSVTYDEYKATYYKYKECYSRCIQVEIKTKESNMIKPVYTQEMSDNGELPPIGSEFIDVELNDVGDDTQVLAIAHDLDLNRVVYRRGDNLEDSEYFGAMAYECKPLPTPVELKAKGLYRFNTKTQSDLIGEAYYVEFEKVWMINALRTNTSYDANNCTNIIKLIPEVL